MAFVNFSSPYNIVTFCETRLNPQAINKLIKENNGLADQTAVDDALQKCDYKRVLTAIWSEKNKERRLTWLRSKQNEFHAPLMFEQCIAEFVAVPTVDTLINISMPLAFAATIRIDQDAKCSQDASVYNGDASTRMTSIYEAVENNVTKKYCPPAENTKVLFQHLDLPKILSNEVIPKGLELLKQIAKQNLPSPEWIGYHGMSVAITGRINMHDRSKWKKIRDDFLTTCIQKFEKSDLLNKTLESLSPATDQKMEISASHNKQ